MFGRFLVRQGEVDVIVNERPVRQTMFVFNDIVLLTIGPQAKIQNVKTNLDRKKLIVREMEEMDDDEAGGTRARMHDRALAHAHMRSHMCVHMHAKPNGFASMEGWGRQRERL